MQSHLPLSTHFTSNNECPHHRQRVLMQSERPCAPSRLLNFPRVWPTLQKTMERQGGKGSSGRPDCIRDGPCSQGGAFDDERLLLTFCLKSKDYNNEYLSCINRSYNKKLDKSFIRKRIHHLLLRLTENKLALAFVK